jgi:hypothetical protein
MEQLVRAECGGKGGGPTSRCKLYVNVTVLMPNMNSVFQRLQNSAGEVLIIIWHLFISKFKWEERNHDLKMVQKSKKY